jgi:hypothetical protein
MMAFVLEGKGVGGSRPPRHKEKGRHHNPTVVAQDVTSQTVSGVTTQVVAAASVPWEAAVKTVSDGSARILPRLSRIAVKHMAGLVA